MDAGTVRWDLLRSESTLRRGSGTATVPTFGSIVQKGKLAAWAFPFSTYTYQWPHEHIWESNFTKARRIKEAHRRCKEMLTTALNRVDFPTFGRPTIPAFKLILIFEEDENRLLIPWTPINWELLANREGLVHRNDDGDFDGRRDKAGNRLLQATLAISILLGFTFEVLKEGLSHETLDWGRKRRGNENPSGFSCYSVDGCMDKTCWPIMSRQVSTNPQVNSHTRILKFMEPIIAWQVYH